MTAAPASRRGRIDAAWRPAADAGYCSACHSSAGPVLVLDVDGWTTRLCAAHAAELAAWTGVALPEADDAGLRIRWDDTDRVGLCAACGGGRRVLVVDADGWVTRLCAACLSVVGAAMHDADDAVVRAVIDEAAAPLPLPEIAGRAGIGAERAKAAVGRLADGEAVLLVGAGQSNGTAE